MKYPGQPQSPLKTAMHVVVLLVLVAIVLFILTWSGIMKCSTIPGWCEVYYTVLGQPKVLIVYGDSGLGDPDLLADILRDRDYIGVYPYRLHTDLLNEGNLKDYHLVIVTRAREMETRQLKYFMNYVNQGGRVVWTGDAGTVLGRDDNFLYFDERPEGKNDHEIIGPWARKEGEKIVAFDDFIGANYKGNYCGMSSFDENCHTGVLAGRLEVGVEPGNAFIVGLKKNLLMRGNFAVVKPSGAAGSTTPLSVDVGGAVKDSNGEDLGRVFPVIITRGGKVAYYALPPEMFAHPDLEEKYYYILVNMYNGMLK